VGSNAVSLTDLPRMLAMRDNGFLPPKQSLKLIRTCVFLVKLKVTCPQQRFAPCASLGARGSSSAMNIPGC